MALLEMDIDAIKQSVTGVAVRLTRIATLPGWLKVMGTDHENEIVAAWQRWGMSDANESCVGLSA